MSYRIGYDVETWVAEGLVDILIPAGGAHTDPLIAVEAYLDMCKGTDVAVYPGFDARVDGWDWTGFRGAGAALAQGPDADSRGGESVARGRV